MIDAVTKTLSATQLDRLEKFAERVNKLDANLVVFDRDYNCVLNSSTGKFHTDVEMLRGYARNECTQNSGTPVLAGPDNEVVGMCVSQDNGIVAIVMIDTGGMTFADNEDLMRLCTQCKVDYQLFRNAALAGHNDKDYFSEMLVALAEALKYTSKAAEQLEIVSTELSQTYEELMLLYKMSTNMKVTESNATYLQMACDQITQSVNVEGIAIFLEKDIDGESRLVLTAGSGLIAIDQMMVDVLQTYLMSELREGKDALLDSQVDSPFKYNWDDRIENIIAVPLQSTDRITGIMVATNIIDKPDFDSIDVKLFNSVAQQCAVFIENDRLFGELKDLFIGSLKALTNSIDAKDQYTRGHSERVAFISRWIAERVSEIEPIDEEQIHKIYLAGLLHDIGKIGIDERVLRKKGSLTEDERNQIMAHPRIGAGILSEIKQMKEVVPGVLCHHERVDGKGYPQGLTGEMIPLIGKIINLADAFDAMTSKRVYRDAMSIRRSVAEIERGLGTQFDEKIGKIFINSDIKKLWSIIQDGFIECWDYSNFSEYGAKAVGTLVR